METLIAERAGQMLNYDNMFDGVPVVVFEINEEDGNKAFSFVSSYVNEIFSTKPDNLIDDINVFRSLLCEDSQKLFDVILDKEGFYSKVFKIKTPDKDSMKIHVSGEVTFLKDGRKSLVGSMARIKDIFYGLSDEGAFCDAAFSAPISIVITDIDGKVIFANEYFLKKSGYGFEELMQKSASDILFDEDGNAVSIGLKKLKLGRSHKSEVKCRGKKGFFWTSLIASPIFDETGKVIKILTLGRDITDRKKVEEELREAKEKAEDILRNKSEFLAVMSHEIRTPMNGIMGMLQVLSETQLSPEQRSYLETVIRSSEILTEILNDVLDLSKIEADSMRLENITYYLDDVINSVSDLMQAKAKQKGLDIEVIVGGENNHFVVGDPVRIKQILNNLISNAIKFTDNGRISIRAFLAKDTVTSNAEKLGLNLHIDVVDTGIGMSAEAQAKVFDAFVQADDSIARKYGGSGLGLSITKNLVSLMGGTIGLESEEGRGTRFWFDIPIRQANIEEVTEYRKNKEAKGEQVISATKLKVLLAEDNSINAQVITLMLEQYGHNVSVAIDGDDAILKASEKAYDMIVMDVRMPIKDGFSAANHIRDNDGPNQETPIIVMTADVLDGELSRKCKQAGVDGFLSKPVAMEEMQGEINKCYSKKIGVKTVEHKNIYQSSSDKYLAVDILEATEVALGIASVKSLVADFMPYADDYINRMHKFVLNEDWENLRIISHSFKSTSSYLGFCKLSDASKLIEKSCVDKKFNVARKEVAELFPIYERTISELQAERPNYFYDV